VSKTSSPGTLLHSNCLGTTCPSVVYFCNTLTRYDVLIDADLKPWLIEVNSSPSLARDNPLDYEIKDALLRDVLAVVDAPAVDRTALKDVLQVACAVTCVNFCNVMLVVLQRRLGDRRRLSNVGDAKTAAAAGAEARSPCTPCIQHSSAPARYAAHLARTRAPQVLPPPPPPAFALHPLVVASFTSCILQIR
jgi:hypothetical protein